MDRADMTPTTPTQGEMRLVPVEMLTEIEGLLWLEGYEADAQRLHDLIASPSAPVVGREEIRNLLNDHIDARLAGPREDYAEVVGIEDAADAILSALHASPDKMEKGR